MPWVPANDVGISNSFHQQMHEGALEKHFSCTLVPNTVTLQVCYSFPRFKINTHIHTHTQGFYGLFILTFTLSTSSHVCEISLSWRELNFRLSLSGSQTPSENSRFSRVCFHLHILCVTCVSVMMLQKECELRKLKAEAAFLTPINPFRREICHVCDSKFQNDIFAFTLILFNNKKHIWSAFERRGGLKETPDGSPASAAFSHSAALVMMGPVWATLESDLKKQLGFVFPLCSMCIRNRKANPAAPAFLLSHPLPQKNA